MRKWFPAVLFFGYSFYFSDGGEAPGQLAGTTTVGGLARVSGPGAVSESGFEIGAKATRIRMLGC